MKITITQLKKLVKEQVEMASGMAEMTATKKTKPATKKITNSTKLFLVMLKSIPELQLKKGHRMEIRPRDLRDDGYYITLGHGMDEIIPRDYFRLEEVTIKRTVIEEETITEIV